MSKNRASVPLHHSGEVCAPQSQHQSYLLIVLPECDKQWWFKHHTASWDDVISPPYTVVHHGLVSGRHGWGFMSSADVYCGVLPLSGFMVVCVVCVCWPPRGDLVCLNAFLIKASGGDWLPSRGTHDTLRPPTKAPSYCCPHLCDRTDTYCPRIHMLNYISELGVWSNTNVSMYCCYGNLSLKDTSGIFGNLLSPCFHKSHRDANGWMSVNSVQIVPKTVEQPVNYYDLYYSCVELQCNPKWSSM